MSFASCSDITNLQTQIDALQAASQVADGSETKVVAGTNVTVTGTGTSANPYVVSSSGAASVAHDGTMTGTGTSGDPLSVVQATETQRGAVELATVAESQAGTSTTTAVTPAGLAAAIAAIPALDGSETKLIAGTNTTVTGSGTTAAPYVVNVPTATEALAGAVELATVAESQAGTSSNTAVTPAGLSAAIAAAQQVLAYVTGSLAISSGNSIALKPVYGNDATTVLFYAFPA